MKLAAYPFIQARNFTPASRSSADLVVIHTMEAPEKPGTARAVAAWFSSSSAPRASAHFCIDDHEIVQCVELKDVAWHAPGANRTGIGLEHAGYAKQTPGDWGDAYSRALLERSAKLTAELCRIFGIPVVKLGPTELRSGARGICGHVDVSKAFGKSDHWDPGLSFPWGSYLERVAELSAADTEPAPAPPAARPTLRRGATGEDVRELQALLNDARALHFEPLLIQDGAFGPRTEQAVLAFQRDRGLVADGVVGPNTWAALQ